MSLFIGNISKSVSSVELEKLFTEYGSCRINYKGSYAFAEFDHEKDAQEAIENLQSRDMGGREINIEWSKKSRKFDESKSSRRRRSVSKSRNDGRCYNCGRKGHYLRDCKSRRRHSHSRSRSRSRRRRSSSRDRKHGHRSKRRSHSRSSRSHSYRRRGRKDISKSSSSSRSKRRSESSRDRSPYEKRRRHRSEDDKKDRNNHKTDEKNISNNNNKRVSRSSSRRSDRSPSQKKNNKSSEYKQSKINQILDKDMIKEKYRNGDKLDAEINENKNDIADIKIDHTTKDDKNKYTKNNTENQDNSKLKTDDIKSELKKKGISYSKNARKSDLIDLLTSKKD